VTGARLCQAFAHLAAIANQNNPGTARHFAAASGCSPRTADYSTGDRFVIPVKVLKRCHSRYCPRYVHQRSHALRRTHAIVPLGNQLRQWMVKEQAESDSPCHDRAGGAVKRIREVVSDRNHFGSHVPAPVIAYWPTAPDTFSVPLAPITLR